MGPKDRTKNVELGSAIPHSTQSRCSVSNSGLWLLPWLFCGPGGRRREEDFENRALAWVRPASAQPSPIRHDSYLLVSLSPTSFLVLLYRTIRNYRPEREYLLRLGKQASHSGKQKSQGRIDSQHRSFQALIDLAELGNVGERLLELKAPPFPETRRSLRPEGNSRVKGSHYVRRVLSKP